MSLVKFSNSNNPYRYNSIYNDALFNDLFNWNNRQVANNKTALPFVNIKETEKDYQLEMATPGLKKEDLKMELNKDILTISSEQKQEKEETKENYSHREFSYSSFSRSFTLPKTVNTEAITAKYENGILEITIPKKEEAQPKPKMEIAIA